MGKKRSVVDVTLTLTGHGGLANNIPATLFGLQTITSVRVRRANNAGTDVFVPAQPSNDGSLLLLGSHNTGTSLVAFPADITASLRVEVEGITPRV